MIRTTTLLWVAVCLFLAARASADGVYIPERAYPAMPAIPAQRAMIVCRDGTETLVVESTLQTEARNVGWIVPVPAEPTKLELGDGGMLTSLSMSMRPRITHDLKKPWEPLLVLLLASIPIAAIIIFELDAVKRRRSIWAICLFYVCILLLSTILLPSLGRERDPAATVDVTLSQRLGDFEISVLRADDADALSKWLKNNGLTPLNAAAGPIVDDYASRKWYFLVARLSPSAAGAATPLPLAVRFPVTAPVFPMKLTALAGASTQVELMVVADQEASAPGFHCVAADRFRLRRNPKGAPSDMEAADYYDADDTGLVIGNPDAALRMWDGCTVTKLTAEFAPSQMNADVPIGLTNLVSYRDHFFSADARLEIVISVALIGCVFSVPIVAFLFQHRQRPSRRQVSGGLALVALIPIAVLITYRELPIVAVHTSRSFFFSERDFRLEASDWIRRGDLTSDFDDKEADEFLNGIQKYKYDINPYTGNRRKRERSPGNFSTRTVGDQVYFCVYDADGREFRIKFPESGDTQANHPRTASTAASIDRTRKE